MAEDNVGSGSKPSWHEREIALALQRLANARAQLATLEEQRSGAADAVEHDPADIARAEELQVEIDRLVVKASGRFGGGARNKLDECQLQQRLVLERLGVESIEALRASADSAASPAVDATVLDFARRECAEAERAFLEVAAMVIPEAEAESDVDAEVIEPARSFGDDEGDLDLRIEPSAAS